MKKLLALAALAAVAGSAGAATLSEDINFSLFGFVEVDGYGTPPPVGEIDGSITITYDPSLSYDNDTTDVVVHSLTGVNSDSPPGFTYSGGYLEFGGTQNDSDLIYSNTNDFVLALYVSDPTHPQLIPCSTPGYTCGSATGDAGIGTGGYTETGTFAAWFYSSGSVISPTPITPSVPEPAPVALLAAGLGVLAFLRRRPR